MIPDMPICSHCGRPGCVTLGSPECQAAREKFFETMRQLLTKKTARDATSSAESPK